MNAPAGVRGVTVSPVPDGDYAGVAAHLIATARARCWLGVFILDPRTGDGARASVDTLVDQLRAAAWRGVDVRVLIGGSRTNLEIAETARYGCDVCRSLGLEARWLTATDVRGSHAKVLLTDRHVLVGSHNWTNGALSGQVQDSVAIESAALAATLAGDFSVRWNEAVP